jgi:glycosyltransferase involved in cell wall biosynthesis
VHKKRVLVVSHECVTLLNQQIYAEIQRLSDWSFTLLLPAVWKDEFGNLLRPAILPGFDAGLVTAPVRLNGNIILHSYQFNFRRFLNQNKFDLIYVNHEPYGVSTAQVCWANLQTVKLPFGFHSCQNIYKQYPIPFRWLERMVYRSSSFAFPITEAVARVLRQKGFTGGVGLCPFPFDPDLYHPLPEAERKDLIPRAVDEVVIGYVGRMVEQKGLQTLIEALARLPLSRWKLVVIGTGPYESRFDELVSLHGLTDRVTRLGYVAHDVTPRYLAALDILVLPSETRPNWKEQFGRVLIEAMACGVCVVGSDSGEIPTLIKASGGGRVFPEAKPEALAEVLQELIRDENQRRTFARNGGTWVNKNISLPAVATSMAGAMQEALAGVQPVLLQPAENENHP